MNGKDNKNGAATGYSIYLTPLRPSSSTSMAHFCITASEPNHRWQNSTGNTRRVTLPYGTPSFGDTMGIFTSSLQLPDATASDCHLFLGALYNTVPAAHAESLHIELATIDSHFLCRGTHGQIHLILCFCFSVMRSLTILTVRHGGSTASGLQFAIPFASHQICISQIGSMCWIHLKALNDCSR